MRVKIATARNGQSQRPTAWPMRIATANSGYYVVDPVGPLRITTEGGQRPWLKCWPMRILAAQLTLSHTRGYRHP